MRKRNRSATPRAWSVSPRASGSAATALLLFTARDHDAVRPCIFVQARCHKTSA